MSKIQWTECTANPIHLIKLDGSNGGHWCHKISAGCLNCYAEDINLGNRFNFASKLAFKGIVPDLRLDESILKKWQTKKGKNKLIFVCSMTDLFGDWIPFQWQSKIFDAMMTSPHTFQVLTKRPHNLYKFLMTYNKQITNNIWLGTSIENQECDHRLFNLCALPIKNIKFLSLEPLLGKIDLKLNETLYENNKGQYKHKLIDWVIVGGESGKKARPCQINWITDIVNQCQEYNIPVFVKQLGSNSVNEMGVKTKLKDKKGGNIDEFPFFLKIRQFPNLK